MIISRSNDCPYCGPSHSNSCYVLYETGDYCFSCNNGTSKSVDYYSFRNKLQTQDEELFIPSHTLNPSEFSVNVLKWLYSYYVYDDVIKQHHIAYCEAYQDFTESVLLPLLDDNNDVVAYQRRFFPKRFISSKNLKQHLFYVENNYEETICLVEDYISAIRVGQVENCLCLFGTSLTEQMSQFIVRNCDNVKIWLDNDKAGIEQSEKLYKTLLKNYKTYVRINSYEARTIKLSIIHSDKQPKEYTNSEIKQRLMLC